MNMKSKRKQTGPTLREYCETYIAERDLSPDYIDLLKRVARRYSEWKNREVRVAELKCADANRWLAQLRAEGVQGQTLAGYRRQLRCLWMAAYMDELCEEPPFRLKTIRCQLPIPEAYTLEEIKALVDAAKKLVGFSRDGARWSYLWPALILGAYSTGLRRGDLFRVMRSQIAGDGTANITQHKTGYTVTVRFSAEAMEFIRLIQTDDGRAFPWPYHPNIFSKHWQALKKAAGVSRGEFRWLRRSAASYAEKVQPGLGTRLLGHRDPRLVVRHYADPTISAAEPVALPAVG